MITRVKAKFTNGHIVPLEPLNIEEGAELVVAIEDTAAPKRGLAAIVERVKELHKDIPPEEWKDIPPDLAMNKKHYLYGHPKDNMFDDIRKSLSHIPKEPGPTDGAKNYKHYLYGHPKED